MKKAKPGKMCPDKDCKKPCVAAEMPCGGKKRKKKRGG